MLDSRDFAPIGFQRVNNNTGKEVDWGHIVKGYEYKKGEFVALANADFKHAVQMRRSRSAASGGSSPCWSRKSSSRDGRPWE